MTAKMELREIVQDLIVDPHDPASWSVYADALASLGDPLGEHIALALALERPCSPKVRRALERALAELHEGPAARRLLGPFRPAAIPNARNFELEWFRGTIHKARCRAQRDYYDGPVTSSTGFAALMPQLLALPAAGLMRSLSIHTSRRPRHTAQVLALLARIDAPHPLERLHVGWGLYPTRTAYNLDPELLPTRARWNSLLAQFPRLRVMSLHGHLVPLPGFRGNADRRLAALNALREVDDASMTLVARAILDRREPVQLAAIAVARRLGPRARSLVPSLSICLLRYVAPPSVQSAAREVLDTLGHRSQFVL